MTDTVAAVQGTWDPRFDSVAQALAEEIGSGAELGASIAVDVDGELVVDIWGGHADRAKTIPWHEDTIVNFWSCTKTLTALAALILVDRGAARPVRARRVVLAGVRGERQTGHRGPAPSVPYVRRVGLADALRRREPLRLAEKATSHLAGQAPWWKPGTASGYHAMDYGHLIGEVVRRITGKSLKDFVQQEIAAPLGADVQIGARAEDDGRIAELMPPPPLRPGAGPPATPITRSSRPSRRSRPARSGSASAETTAWRRADIGGANGHGNARGLVRAMSPISLGGTANGVEILLTGDHRADLRRTVQRHGPGAVRAAPFRNRVRIADTAERALRPRRKDLLVGWLGRLDDRHGSRPPRHVRLRHEQDGRRHHGYRPHDPLQHG